MKYSLIILVVLFFGCGDNRKSSKNDSITIYPKPDSINTVQVCDTLRQPSKRYFFVGYAKSINQGEKTMFGGFSMSGNMMTFKELVKFCDSMAGDKGKGITVVTSYSEIDSITFEYLQNKK